MSRSRRARFRNRGSRKETRITEKKLMWAILTCTTEVKDNEYANVSGYYYAPYVPIMRDPMKIFTSDSTA